MTATLERCPGSLQVTTHAVGQNVLIAIEGALDALTAPALRDAVLGAAATCPGHVYLDMTEVRTVDVAGLQVVESLTGHGSSYGAAACILRPSDALLRLQELVRGLSPTSQLVSH